MACADLAETPLASQPEALSDGEEATGTTKPGKAAATAGVEAAADPVAEATMVARRVRVAGSRSGFQFCFPLCGEWEPECKKERDTPKLRVGSTCAWRVVTH